LNDDRISSLGLCQYVFGLGASEMGEDESLPTREKLAIAEKK